jgi:hypothetical protein
MSAHTSTTDMARAHRRLWKKSASVREFQSVFEQDDVINLENHRVYMKLLIDGMPSWPFSARTLPSSKLVRLALNFLEAERRHRLPELGNGTTCRANIGFKRNLFCDPQQLTILLENLQKIPNTLYSSPLSVLLLESLQYFDLSRLARADGGRIMQPEGHARNDIGVVGPMLSIAERRTACLRHCSINEGQRTI